MDMTRRPFSFKMPKFRLNDGNTIPAIGVDTFQGSSMVKTTYSKVFATVSSAIDVGYRHFDTAFVFNTEKAVGDAINAKIKQGIIKRYDVFVTTKLWSATQQRNEVVTSLQKSLECLGLDYIDMYLIHWPKPRKSSTSISRGANEYGEQISEEDQADILDTWQGMEECKKFGFTKSIGVAYPNSNYIDLILKNCEIPPSNIQVECHLLNSNQSLSKYCEDKGIIMSCCFPLGTPRTIESWQEEKNPNVLSNETVMWIAKERQKTPAQIALRYLAQRSLVVLSLADTPERLKEEIDIFNFHITGPEMTCLELCNRDYHVTGFKRLFQPKLQSSMDMGMVVNTPMFPLNDGHVVPAIALGTCQDNSNTRGTCSTVVSAVKSAIDIGYRHFDTASAFGTEQAIGKAITEKIDEGVISRSDVYITTKLWNTCHRRDAVVPALRRSLECLEMDYVDMYLVHWPIAMKPDVNKDILPKQKEGSIIFEDNENDYLDTWKGMEECKKLGLARSIGVCNFNHHQLVKLLASCEIPPSMLQVECHVYNSCESLDKYCKQKKITLSCYSPLSQPNRASKEAVEPGIFTDETLRWIGERHGKTNVQIALRYLLQRGNVISPKSNNTMRQRENIRILDFRLNDAEMEAISIINRDHRVCWGKEFSESKEYPFTKV